MQHTPSPIEYRNPVTLRLHKLRKHFPAIDREASDWIALTDSVAATGIQQPLLITPEGFIVDGAWRWQSAKDWQFEQVPVRVVSEQMAGILIFETLNARKQMTRGATIYLCIPIMRDIIVSAEFRRLENLKNGRKTNEIELKPQHFSNPSNSDSMSDDARVSIKDFCFRAGVSWDTFDKARKVWAWLNEPDFSALKRLHQSLRLDVPPTAQLRSLQEDLRSDFEPNLLIGEKNLWNVESGIKGRLTGGEHELPQKQLELFGDALDSLAVRAERFKEPEKAVPEIRKWLKDWETELIEHQNKSPEEFRERLSHITATTKMAADTMQARLRELDRKMAEA